MLELNREGLKNPLPWERAGISLPRFDIERMFRETDESPEWVHFGAGNIFRAFPAMMQQKLLDEGHVKTGIIAVKTHNWRTVETMYAPFDNLSLSVIMERDGELDITVAASIRTTLAGDPEAGGDWTRLKEIFRAPTLKVVSFTITEKGYSLRGADGELLEAVRKDMRQGPGSP
ncbi:MAG: mannitol dehydrogenase family protein, partial [Synergistaceae bacterium]|nr:mannitol dehydrogenase family protein [Synergistaceae bacterium]